MHGGAPQPGALRCCSNNVWAGAGSAPACLPWPFRFVLRPLRLRRAGYRALRGARRWVHADRAVLAESGRARLLRPGGTAVRRARVVDSRSFEAAALRETVPHSHREGSPNTGGKREERGALRARSCPSHRSIGAPLTDWRRRESGRGPRPSIATLTTEWEAIMVPSDSEHKTLDDSSTHERTHATDPVSRVKRARRLPPGYDVGQSRPRRGAQRCRGTAR
jgi:hypothetical protein